MKKKLISVAADLGASGGKTAKGYFDGDHLTMSDIYTFENRAVDIQGALYWDVFGLYNNITDCLAQYAAVDGIESVAIDTWGASYGLLDRRGRLLEPVYHYRDIRTLHTVDHMYQVADRQSLFEMTGCQCNRTYTLPQLYSYMEQESLILNQASTMLFLPDLFEYFLSGEISTEMTIAGTSALMNTSQENWCIDVFKKFNIPAHMLTSIVDAGTVKGTLSQSVAQSTGAGNAKVIAAVGHDSAAAVAAIPGFGKDKLFIIIGTNINMGVERDESIVNDIAFQGGFKNTGGIRRRKIVYRDFAAFWLINELRRVWKLEGKNYSFSDLIELASKAASKNSFFDVEEQTFNNAGGDMRIKINSYLERTGQVQLETDGEFVLCVLESMTMKVKYCAEFLRQRLSIPFKEVFIINGGSRNSLLVQMISDALHMEVKAGLPYATLAGNVLMQLYSLGKVSSAEEIRELSKRSFEMKIYEPFINTKWDINLQKMIEKGICR